MALRLRLRSAPLRSSVNFLSQSSTHPHPYKPARLQPLLRPFSSSPKVFSAQSAQAPKAEAALADTPEEIVWKLEDVDRDHYWNEYISTRPVYDVEPLERIYKYHTSHSGPFNAAIDIGTGYGSSLKSLTQKFSHVVGSDNDPVSLGFAKDRLSSITSDRLSYTLSTGEDILQHHEPKSFDLVTTAEAIVLMDTQVALHNFATLLRPKGTLAIWFYGRPHFTEKGFAETCQPILGRLLDLRFTPVTYGQTAARASSWKHAVEGMSSWLDYLPFDPALWTDVRRHKWNPDFYLPFYSQDACDFEIKTVSNVREGETTTEEYNHEFWQKEWDFTMVKRFVDAIFPTPKGLKKEDPELTKLLGELEKAMQGGVRKLSWPAALILATRK